MFNFLPPLPFQTPSLGKIGTLANFLFGARVRPRPGSILHCSLAIAVEHSGIFVARDKIVEVENDDGNKNIRRVDADDFLNSHLVRTGVCIYVACDKKTGAVLGTRSVADNAKYAVGREGAYRLLFDNCHMFTSSCITGNHKNSDNLFLFLENTIRRKLNRGRAITWKVWNHDDDEEPSPDGLDERLEEECAELDHELIEGHEIACDDTVRPVLHEELRTWQQEIATKLREKFADSFAALEAAEQSLKSGNHEAEDIWRDITEYAATDSMADTSFWSRKTEELANDADLHPIRSDLQQQWRLSLEFRRNEYYQNEIDRRRTELLKELNGRLVAMQEIAKVAGELGVVSGLLWDQTKGLGARSDLKVLQDLANYLKNNEGVRRLCDLLGRMRRYSASQRIELIKSTTTYQFTVPDVEAKSEIIGITQGRDIDHILPQELALLADPDTEILFDLKFAEGRLMSFDYAGSIEKSYDHEYDEMAPVEEEDKLGPMIICVDTSGSMSGEPENVAKAITLALAMKSIEQKRNCYLISYSTCIETHDLTSNRGLPELLKFLEKSFGGGTDAAPALHHGMKMMKDESYERADLLMISDFAMPDITSELKQQIQAARDRKCKFYALNIYSLFSFGQYFQHHIEFDAEWQYDPKTMGIKELSHLVETV